MNWTAGRTWGLLVICGSILMILSSLRDLVKGRASLRWPSVQGEIIASEVETRKHPAPKREVYTTYRPGVRYRYEVSGRSFESDRISIGLTGKRYNSAAKALVEKYRPGDQIRVFYNPDRPAESVLEPGANRTSYVALGIGILVGLLGIRLFLAK